MTDTRFVVTWTPTLDVERACARRGMKDGDGTSFWDWVQAEHYERHRAFPTFLLAKEFAEKVADADVFGAPRIEQQRLEVEDYGLFHKPVWQRSAWWEVGWAVLVETAPHFTDVD